MASIVCNDTLIQGGGDQEGGLETPTKNALSKPRGLFTQMPEQCASAASLAALGGNLDYCAPIRW